jgi:predicted bacteriocin transport accessory protein
MAEKENEKKKKTTAKKTTQTKKTQTAKKSNNTKKVTTKKKTNSAAKKPAAKKATSAKKQQAKKQVAKKTVAKQPVKKQEVKKPEVKESKKEEALEKTIIFDGRQNKNLAEVVEKLEEKNVVLDDKVVKRSKGKKIAIILLSILMVAVVIADIIFVINYYKQEKINSQTTTSNIYDKAKKNYKDIDDINVEEKKTTDEGEEIYPNIKTITVKEFEEKAFKKENMVVMVSSSTCYHCITFEPTVDKVFKSAKKTIYRIDVASTNQEEIDRFRTYYAFTVTPTIFSVKDGVVVADSTGSIDEESLTKWVNENA